MQARSAVCDEAQSPVPHGVRAWSAACATRRIILSHGESQRCGLLRHSSAVRPSSAAAAVVLGKCFARGLLLAAAPRFARALAAALDLSTLDALRCGDDGSVCAHAELRFGFAAHTLSAPRFAARAPRLRTLALPGAAIAAGRLWALAPLRGTLRALEVIQVVRPSPLLPVSMSCG